MKEILVAPGNTGIKEVDKVQLVELNVKNTKVYVMLFCDFPRINRMIHDIDYICFSVGDCQMEQE